VASTGIPERLCTRLRVEGFDSTGFGTRTLPGREDAMLGERDKGRVWSGAFALLEMRRWERSGFTAAAAAAAEILSPPTRRAASRRAFAWSRDDVASFCLLVGGSWMVSGACRRLCGRKMAGIVSQSARAGDKGGEGRLAGSRRSDEMASASTCSTCESDVPASTATSKGEDAGGVGSLCPSTR